MADDTGVGKDEKKETISTATGNRKKRKGLFSRIWNAIFRTHGDDFEKKLEYISKEEAVVLARMSRRSRSWRRTTRHLILFSVIFEVIAVIYAMMMTRSKDINWKMRAIRILPMFLLPAVSTAAYSTFISFARMFDRRDQKILERLRAERQAKIDELKEKTHYYITQQLIQVIVCCNSCYVAVICNPFVLYYILLSLVQKTIFGIYSSVHGEKFKAISQRTHCNQSLGKGNGFSMSFSRSTSPGTTTPTNSNQQFVGSVSTDQSLISMHNQLETIVGRHQPQSSTTHDGGWIARIVALLVGEDPRQSYALICANCHIHNGLVQKADFPYITYYCRHCHALNKPKELDERISGLSSQNMGHPKADEVAQTASASPGDGIITNNSPVNASLEIEEVSKKPSLEERVG
ncbi:uncharacterized protein At2g24330 [Neltuma alba]|uniref:uncharacterized protein At2g24330 n=1 Tax=Neltuma alba TaxID=207710 RepID=UPI0010A4581B|nr:uncharacterized protein At2g24330 [Prosopis alba]